MNERNIDGLPPDLAEVANLIREDRPKATSLELDEIKTRAMARAQRRRTPAPRLNKGVNVRSRLVTAILTLLVIGGTTAGGIAGGGGSSNDESAAQSQYRPPKCSRDGRECECPKGYSLTVKDNQIVCSKNPGDGGHGGHGGGGDEGHGGHGHHHHNHWRQGHNGHWQCSDDNNHWRDWNGRESDW